MAFGPIAYVGASVTNDVTAVARLTGVIDLGRDSNLLTAVVSRDRINSWDGHSLFQRYRVKIGDDFVPADELVDPLEIDDTELDSHTGSFSFGLVGRHWSIFQTEQVWARTPVEVYLDTGPSGAIVEAAEPTYSGYVMGCDQSSTQEPIVRVRCGDEAAYWEKYEACEEFEPNAGFTRGEIVDTLCQAAGITALDVPDGAEYIKPLQAVNKRLFDVLKPFVEPEGWRLRFRADRTLEVWTPAIKLPPQQPDYVWTRGDITAGGAIPPEDVPSRWIVTGTAVKLTDEIGLFTEVTRTEIQAEYAPIVATEVQQSDGSTIASGYSPLPAVNRVITIIEDSTTKQGDLVVQQVTREYGYYNPSAARLQSNGSTGGTFGNGFNYIAGVFIDEDGRFVRYHIEKFQLIGQREITHTYDVVGTLTSSLVRTYKWVRQTRGVRNVTTPDNATTTSSAYVYDDDQSYAAAFESFGLVEEQQITYTYDEASGAQTEHRQDTYRYFAQGTRVDGPDDGPDNDYYVRFDGTGQKGLTANWQLYETTIENNLLNADGLVKGTQKLLYNWHHNVKADGDYDWGGHFSNANVEIFSYFSAEVKQFNAISEEQTEAVEYPPEGGRIQTTYLGRLPFPRYKASSWVRLVTEPIEVVLDDGTVQAWFGFERTTQNLEYVQNTDEAELVINSRRRRMLAKKVEVSRPDTLARVGDTVQLISHEDGINARFMVTAKKRRWFNSMTAGPLGIYRLEAW